MATRYISYLTYTVYSGEFNVTLLALSNRLFVAFQIEIFDMFYRK